ncbi:MAG: hypothetical protein PHE88_10880 [Elusimicrobia bacterium]|nr:hypothetical protein [Elusimicrobiota bacterium]
MQNILKKYLLMKKYISITFIWIVFLACISAVYGQELDMDEWQQIRKQKEEKTFSEETINTAKPESFQASSTTITSEPTLPPILSEGIELPYDSKLAISGRKFIGMKFSVSKYLNKRDDGRTEPTAAGFELDQQLQVRVKGTVKKKISVNVDYDDTVESKKDISIMYQGDPDEFVQQAAFGDITLSLPGTEFVSYDKAAFGAMAKLKYKNANMYGVFSRTKGTTETKRFHGSTTFEKKDIYDISYQRRKYYRLTLDSSQLPIKPGSERIYIDDKNAQNNTILTSTITAWDVNASTIIVLTAELVYPGSDYTVDYERGIVVFRKTIAQNYVIVVDYEKKDGTRAVKGNPLDSYQIIKDENEALKYELKNYYSIGRTKIIRDDNRNNFILKILDLARIEKPDVAQYPTNVEVDFEAGTFRFTDSAGNDKEPFPSSTYENTPTRNYIIYTEYRYRTKSYLVKPNIVPLSEKILMDGVPINRDTDYFMDYDSGFITFLNEERISDSTLIDITYEWMPFGGQMDQTVIGLRGEYAPFNNFSFGSTFLYNFPAKPLTSPDVHSTPESISVYEFDSRTTFANLPLKPSFSGEYAGSIKNPNIFGNALIDNMEGIKQADTMTTDKNYWKYSANISAEVTANSSLYWENIDVRMGDINSSTSQDEIETKKQVLYVAYKLNSNREASIVYPISRLGVDYTKKLFLDFWMYGNSIGSSGDEITISLGSLNEDADGDGILETEDKNSDGILNPGEDVGIPFHHPDGSITIIGANNGKIDTEDLDGDGILRRKDLILGSFDMSNFVNTDGSIGFKDETGTVYKNISWTGWKHFVLPLGDTATWEAVKQIRLTIKSPLGNSNVTNVQFTDISIVGNKWEKPTVYGTGINNMMTATAINNVDNIGYTPLYSQFPSLYTDLYNLAKKDLTGKKEQALSLKYTLESGSTATTKTVFASAANYSNHKKLTYFLWGNNSGGAVFSMQIGADSAYYEHTIVPDWVGWKKIVLELVDINKDAKPDTIIASEGTIKVIGKPALTNISQIKLLVKNTTGSKIENGEIWVDEIYLDEAWQMSGYAHRENADFSIPGWATFGAKYKYIDRDFQTLTTQIANRDYEEMSGYLNMPQIWFLKPSFLNWISIPLNTSVSKILTVTPSAVQTGDTNLVSILDEGKVTTVTGNGSTSITIQKFPRIGASYSKSITETNLTSQRDETNSYSGTFDYTNPLKLYVTPNDLSASYSRSNSYLGRPQRKVVNFGDLLGQTTSWYFLTYTDNYSGRTSFTPLNWMDDWIGIKPFSNLSLTPNYKYTITQERKRLIFDEETKYPKNDSQAASLATSFRIFSWFQPAASYNSNINQTYNLITSTTGNVTTNTKSIDRTAGGNVSVSLSSRDIINFKPMNSLSLNSSYEIADGDSYENVRNEIYIYNKLWIRDFMVFEDTGTKRRSYTISDTIRENARWAPFEFIDFQGRLTPIKSIMTTSAYSKTDRRNDTTGTTSRSVTLNWPDISAGISETEKFFFVEKYVTDTQVNLRYTKRITDDYAFSRKIKYDQSIATSYDYRFNFIKKFDCFTSYSLTTNLSEDISQNRIMGDGKSQTAAFQVGYRYKDWRFTPRYDWQNNFEVDGTPKVTKDSVNQTYSVGVNYDVSKPILWKLPFSSIVIDLKNRFTLTSNLRYATNTDKIVDVNNTDTYSLSLSGDYSISDNLQINLGSSGSYFKNRKRKQDNYYSFDISSSLTITF